MRVRELAILCLLVWLPSGARSNDSAFGSFGSDLFPVEESRVAMESEHIRLTWNEAIESETSTVQGDVRGWTVDARYVFRNLSSEAVSVQMGFPEMLCVYSSSDECVGNGGRFQGLATSVRGHPIQHREEQTGGTVAEELDLGRVHLFSVDFEPGERVEVVHRYHVAAFFLTDYEYSLLYLTRTGAYWAGNIGEARFTVRVPTRPWSVAWRQGFEFVSETVATSEEGMPFVELEFLARDWDASSNFAAAFGQPFMAYEPEAHEGWARGFPVMNALVPSPDGGSPVVDGWSTELLHKVLHHLEAHQGQRFRSELLNALHFRDERTVEEVGGNVVLHGGFRTVGHRPAVNWRDMPISSREQELRRAILQEIRTRAQVGTVSEPT